MDLKTMTLEQKKAVAYDLIVQLETVQRNLQIINQSIQNDSNDIKSDIKVD